MKYIITLGSLLLIDFILCFWIEKKNKELYLSKKAFRVIIGCGLIVLLGISIFYEKQKNVVLFYWYFIFWNYLLLMSIYDLKYRILPDEINIYFLFSYFCILFNNFDFNVFIQHIITAIITGGFLGLVYLIRKDAIGLGDIKLLILSGLYVGPESVVSIFTKGIFILFLISIILLLLKKAQMKSSLPFVPFLFLGALLTM